MKLCKQTSYLSHLDLTVEFTLILQKVICKELQVLSRHLFNNDNVYFIINLSWIIGRFCLNKLTSHFDESSQCCRQHDSD